MTKVISFMAFKGGCGKTTSLTNTAGVLANQNKRVLIIDGDFQGNSTLAFGFDPDSAEGYSLYELLHGDITLDDAIIATSNKAIDIIPATSDLSVIDMDMVTDMLHNKDKIWDDHYYIMTELVEKIKNEKNYDYIIIDSGPSLSFFSSNIILATDIFMIPLQFGKFGYRGTKKFITEIKRIRTNNSDYEAYVFGTFYHHRQNISKDLLDIAKNELPLLGVTLADTKIPKSINYENAPSYHNLPLTLVEPNSPYSAYYKNLVWEVKI